MGFNLGDTFPNFTATVYGAENPFDFYKYIGDSWAILFSHPADFTPVCTTELGKVALLQDEFAKRGCKLVAFSCSPVESHESWAKDIVSYVGSKEPLKYPIVADPDRSLASSLGIMDPKQKDKEGLALTCRCVFFIGPDKKLKASILYPASTGRSMAELLRVVDSLQLSDKYPLATPEGWNSGDKCMVAASLTDDQAAAAFPLGFDKAEVPSGKNYIRLTPTPTV